MFDKIKSKLKNRHFLSLAGNGAMAGLSLITYSMLYRLVSKVDMGNWVFFQFSFIFIDTIRTGFLQTALVKFYPGASRERAANISGSAWYIGLSLTVIFLVVDAGAFASLQWFENESIIMFIRWAGIAYLLTLPFNVATWILQAEQRFDKILYIRVINQGSFILLLVFFYFFNGHRLTLPYVVYSYMLSSLLVSVVCLLTGWAQLRALSQRTNACTSEIFHFGKYCVGTVVSSSLFKTSDTFIINFMLGPVALANYNLSSRLLEMIEIPIRSFLATAMPEMSVAVAANDYGKVANIMKKYAGMLTLLLIPVSVVAIVFADVIIGLIGGGKYAGTEAANVFRIFMLFAMLNPIDRFLGITLDMINKPQLNLYKVLISLVVNAGTDVIGIMLLHNVYGPAFASFFTFIAALVYGYLLLRKYLNFTMLGILKTGYVNLKQTAYDLLFKFKLART